MAKATIIIPVYNKEKYLKDTLISVDKQTEDDLEVIIIDDASTDNSIDIIHDFVSSTKKQVEIIKNDINKGVAFNRNLGIKIATSDYIAFLDADDLLERNFIKEMLNKTEKYPDIKVIRGCLMPFKNSIGVLDDGEIPGYYDEQLIVPTMNTEYVTREIVSCCARFYKSEFIKNLSFKESSFEDYEFFLETVINCNSILYTKEAKTKYRINSNGKHEKSMEDFHKSCTDYFEIHDRIEKTYPIIDDKIRNKIIERLFHISIKYLRCVLCSNISSQDKFYFAKYYLEYLNGRYQLDHEIIEQIISEKITPTNDLEETKRKLKQITIKYW